MIQQSLMKRKPKANVAQTFVGVLAEDDQGRPATVLVPGSDAKQYHVIIRRFGTVAKNNLTVTLECRLDIPHGCGYLDCPGNGPARKREQDTICYHARAALDFAIVKKKKTPHWCQSEEDAELLAQMGGQIFQVRSHQNSARAWVVVK